MANSPTLPTPRSRSTASPLEILDRPAALGVVNEPTAPLPNTPIYAPAIRLTTDKFYFTLRELIHTIAVMTTPLGVPIRKKDITPSHYLAVGFDHRRTDLGFRKFRGSDVLGMKSQSTGIGIACLMCRQLWKFPLKGMEPLAIRGKRFDYRAKKGNLTALFEAKGATSTSVQTRQVKDGIAKKKIQHRNGVRADIELVVSTCVTRSISTPSSVTLADPTEFVPEWTFDEDGDLFYETRHWIRVLNFIGARRSAERLTRLNLRPGGPIALNAPRYDTGPLLNPRRPDDYSKEDLELLEVEGLIFVGRWIPIAVEGSTEPLPFTHAFQGMQLEAYHEVADTGSSETLGDYRVLKDPAHQLSGSVHEDFSALFLRHRLGLER